MKKSLICMVLALALTASLLTGCGSSSAPAEESPAATSATPEESAPASESAAPEESAPAESAAPAEEQTPEVSQAPAISYPLEGDDNSISFWYYIPVYTKFLDGEQAGNSDFHCVSYAEEQTGVHLEFVEVGQTVVQEQFNLMVASGNWTDLMPINEYYKGGLIKAYNDDVIIDMTDVVSENMPDYLAVLNQQTEKTQKQVLSEGKMLAFAAIADGTYSGSGFVTRGDWLEEQGYEFSGKKITIDEFTGLLEMLHDKYSTPNTYYLTADGSISLSEAFDTAIPPLASNFMISMNAAAYRIDDTVVSGWTSDGYYDYLQWLLKMFDEGVIYKDFINIDDDRMVQNDAIGTGKVGLWAANADKLDECANFTDDANKGFKAQAVPVVVPDQAAVDAESVWKQDVSLVSFKTSISATSEKADLCCKWMNYFWTQPGSMLANYGIENDSYTVDENGDWHWTELVTDNPMDANPEMCSTLYTMQRFVSFYGDNDRLLATFTDNALSAVELWTVDGVDKRYYPSDIQFTTDQTERITSKLNDVTTYGQENVYKFLTGNAELSEETWQSFVDGINQMGLTEIIAVYQEAYDAYIAA